MGIVIQNTRHYVTRFPMGVMLIIFFGLSPLLIGSLGGWLTEFLTGQPCHEGNCAWMALPWLTLMTAPIGAMMLLVYLVVIAIDSIGILKRKK